MVIPEPRIQGHLMGVNTTVGGGIIGFETIEGGIIQLNLGLL